MNAFRIGSTRLYVVNLGGAPRGVIGFLGDENQHFPAKKAHSLPLLFMPPAERAK
jgi:hypothetical protein